MGRGRKARTTAGPSVVGATPATEGQPFVISLQQRQAAQAEDVLGVDAEVRKKQPAKLKPVNFFTAPPRTEIFDERDDDGGDKDMTFKKRAAAAAPANLGEISGSEYMLLRPQAPAWQAGHQQTCCMLSYLSIRRHSSKVWNEDGVIPICAVHVGIQPFWATPALAQATLPYPFVQPLPQPRLWPRHVSNTIILHKHHIPAHHTIWAAALLACSNQQTVPPTAQQTC